MGRRVVVTGLGLICGVGNSTDVVWKSVLAGKSGVGRITSFDPTAFACQIAAEVKNFDPLNFIEKKEVKKMGRFIHVAIAAADEAFQDVGTEGHTGKAMSASAFTSGRAYPEVSTSSSANTLRYDRRRPAQDLSVLHSRRHRQSRSRPGFDALWG